MRIKITATLGVDELDELIAAEMRRRFGMADAEISVNVKSWGGAEVTIIEAEKPEPVPVPSSEEAP